MVPQRSRDVRVDGPTGLYWLARLLPQQVIAAADRAPSRENR